MVIPLKQRSNDLSHHSAAFLLCHNKLQSHPHASWVSEPIVISQAL